MAAKAAGGHWVWLGGRKTVNDSQWQWTGNATWGFTNWESDGTKNYRYLRMMPGGLWSDYKSSDENRILCQGPTVTLTRNGSERFELTKEQLAFFPFHVLFRSHISDQGILNTSPDEEGRIAGFTLNWFLRDSNGSQLTEKLAPKQEDWKQEFPIPKSKQPLLAKMVQLARHLRIKRNMTRELILDKVIAEKIQHISILKESGMCEMEQIRPEHLDEAFLLLVTSNDKEDLEGPTIEEDITTGFDLFHAVVYCPLQMDIKLFRFVDQLLSNNESARTTIQTFVNLLHSGMIKDSARLTLANKFYMILASTLNLQYGNVLLATSTRTQLQAVVDNDWPFFTDHIDLVKTCLLNSDCDGIQDIVQNLGSTNVVALQIIPNIVGQNPLLQGLRVPHKSSLFIQST